MHPPKANEPAANADPSEGKHDHVRSYIASGARFSNKERIAANAKGLEIRMSILRSANGADVDANGDILPNPGNCFRSCAEHQAKVAPLEGSGRNLPM